MAIRDAVRDPYEDTRSSKEKRSDIIGAVASIAGVVAIIASRRKVALTRGISRDIISAGLGADTRFTKYVSATVKNAIGSKSKTVREAALESFEDSGVDLLSFIRDVFKPLPSGEEQYHIATNYLEKHLKYPKTLFPVWKNLGIKEPSFWRQMIYGPAVAPFGRGTELGVVGRKGVPKTLGQYGGMVMGESLYFLNDPVYARETGKVFGLRIKGMHASITNTIGAHLERGRRGTTKALNPKDVLSYVRRVELDPRAVMEAESRWFYKTEYFNRFNVRGGQIFGKSEEEIMKSGTEGKSAKELRELASKWHHEMVGERQEFWLNPVSNAQERIPTLRQFMYNEGGAKKYGLSEREGVTVYKILQQRAAKTRIEIAQTASQTKSAQLRFEAFKLGRKLGYGEEFASHGGGVLQGVERKIREGVGWTYKHPVSGEPLPVAARRYNITRRTLGTNWEGQEGAWYLSGPGDLWKRWASIVSGGTFHTVGAKAFGFGITNRPNATTDFIKDLFGVKSGTYADLWIRSVGQTGRIVGLGMGAFFGYKFVNYLSRQVLGWGPTDVAAGAYVKAREFQQNVLQGLHVVNAAKAAENAFPGSVSSPASHLARLALPLTMSYLFGRKGGTKGYALGLALGTAMAMVTWGDLTQSPEELHRIFTGEQDIPLKKGRYWLLGKTPFFGGKVSYWKKHWYPLLKSNYKYQGGLWDSETEYWAQGTPFSPILAPLMTGRPWDPYYWEKKHRRDRPYPVTGEMFEPTMPFAWLANLTIGRIMKPSTYMHEQYLGREQGAVTGTDRRVPMYTGLRMGYQNIPGIGISRAQNPVTLRNQLGMAAYTQTEQMGLMGFAANTIYEKLTGQTDFMAAQTILQSSRRATGYERSYWEKELGDPGAGLDEGLTEYFRRFLPHRRTSADEYNPIPNEMPSWMPGEDYFTNFQQGDPYVKVPLGESRLPGPGYEALNPLHSGIPHSYDAVDRFLILANVAPYSNEYKEYSYLAKAMVKGDDYWSNKVQRAAGQRNSLNQEYEFMSTDAPKDVPFWLRPASFAYRNTMAAITNFPNPLEMAPHLTRFGPFPTHISKWFQYRTPEGAYRDYRLYGSEYAMWDQPMSGFITPYMRKLRGTFDQSYVPKEVQRRREIQEYFDKLKYVKYANLAQEARIQGNSDLSMSLTKIAKSTMVGSPYHAGAAMMAAPKEEKSFFSGFSEAQGEHRTRIMNMIPSYMRNYYMTAWNQQDTENGIGPSYDVDYQKSKDLTAYYRNHYLPPPEWLGWHPEVSLDQVKLRVVKNEAFDIHKFNLWESNERQLARQPFTPIIENINGRNNDLTMLQNTMISNMERFGLSDNRVFVSRTPASENSYNMRIHVNRDRAEDHNKAMRSSLSMR